MQLSYSKSLIVAAFCLIEPIRNLIYGFPAHSHIVNYATMILGPSGAVYCIWHALEGTKPLMGYTGAHTSRILATAFILLGVALILVSGIRSTHRTDNFLIGLLFCTGGAMFFRDWTRERKTETDLW